METTAFIPVSVMGGRTVRERSESVEIPPHASHSMGVDINKYYSPMTAFTVGGGDRDK